MYFTSRLRYDRYDIEDVRRSAAPAAFCHDHTRSDPPTHLPTHNERLLLFVGRKGKHGRCYSLHTEQTPLSTHARRCTYMDPYIHATTLIYNLSSSTTPLLPLGLPSPSAARSLGSPSASTGASSLHTSARGCTPDVPRFVEAPSSYTLEKKE